jgi:hypothetical protein
MYELILTIVGFIMRNTLFLFIVAFAGGLIGHHYAATGRRGRAKWLFRAAFVCASLLCMVHIIGFAMMASMTDFLFAALWGYFSWRNLQFLRTLS